MYNSDSENYSYFHLSWTKAHNIKCMNSYVPLVEVSIHMTTLENNLLLSYIVGNTVNIVECLLCSSYFPKFTNTISFYPSSCEVHTVIFITLYMRELT